MNPGLFELEALVRREVISLGDLLFPAGESQLPGFRVAFAGPGRSGKTSLVRALLGEQADNWLALGDQQLPSEVPTEYRYGACPELSVRRTKDGSWMPVRSLTAPLNLSESLRQVGCSFDALSISLPLPALREWDAVLVDTPPVGVTARLDGLIGNELARCDAVIWVMDSRRWGLSDHEIEFLHALPRPLIFLSNNREADLIPTGIPVEVKEVPFNGPRFPGVFPIISVACHQDLSQERQLLFDLLGLLRRAQLEQGEPGLPPRPALLGAVEQLRTSIAAAAGSKLRSLQRIIVEDRHLDGLKALRGLQELMGRLRGQIPESLANLLEIRKALETAGDLDAAYCAAIVKAEELARTYNIRAGAKAGNSFSEAGPHDSQFGDSFTKPRNELHKFLENVLQVQDDLMLGKHDILALGNLCSDIEDGRVEIALLGMFSSGKSALVNSLLGVPINDLDSELLPTKPTVATATVNRLEWADAKQLNKVDWLDDAELFFLQNKPGVGVRVREQEITAFEKWVKTGAVRFEDCDIQEFDPPKGAKPLSAEKLFESLLQEVRWQKGGFRSFILEGSKSRLAGRVKVRKFCGARPGLVPGMPLKEAFLIAESPEVSLQIRMMHIGAPHQLLKHGAIIDTPGTDSHIPHHRTLSRGLIKKSRVPIIYCFLSSQPGGREDSDNLQVLLDAGEETMRRVFFVITRKGDIEEANREELRRHVRTQLDKIGMPVQALHFIELLKFADPEFKDFSAQLTEFIKAGHAPQLCTWAAVARDLLAQAAANACHNLADLELEITDRAAKVGELEAKLGQVKRIALELSSGVWGAPYLRRRVSDEIERGCGKISDVIDALQDRDDFNGLAARLESEEEELNASFLAALPKIINAMQSKLKAELAGVRAGKPADYRFETEGLAGIRDYFQGPLRHS